jgi:hypothetical protein
MLKCCASSAIALVLVLGSAYPLSRGTWAAAPNSSSPNTPEVSPGTSADQQKITIEKLQADISKTKADVEKTNAEVANLREIGPGLNRFVTVTTAIGGLAGAIFGGLIAILVARLNTNYNRVQTDKLRQDREFEHEKHNLELYQGLGSDNPRGQFAAAVVLLQRLEQLCEATDVVGDLNVEADKTTITHVLISILKEQVDDGNLNVLRKHIADNLVKALKLVKWDGHPEIDRYPSYLASFDLQKSKLNDVFWRGVNLRNVDLYGSDLTRASLRNADLRNAVLYQAILVRSKFNNADLENANLEAACVEYADFSGANLTGTRLIDAKFNNETKWPTGFDPVEMGATASETAAKPSTVLVPQMPNQNPVSRGAVVALAGRRIDALGANPGRFPLKAVPMVRRGIADLFVRERAVLLVCSGACGAELIALEVAAELDLRRRIVLPFAPELFRQTSVVDRPGDWGAMFDRFVTQACAEGDLIILNQEADDEYAYTAAYKAILDEAQRFARSEGGSPTYGQIAAIVWEGAPRSGSDWCEDFRTKAVRDGFELRDILTR